MAPLSDIPPSLAGFRSIAGLPNLDAFLLPASQLHYDYPHPPALLDTPYLFDPPMHPPPYLPPPPSLPARTERTRTREKKHACWMCEKSFDRPSTLRKHLLVHTGEKAFVCTTCGRRFGVASNLNRHVKRCILKPVNRAKQEPPAADLPSTSTDSPPTTTTRSRKRTREPDMPESSPQPGTSDSAPKPAKRRRRAPSPTQWVPQSLAHFTIPPIEYSNPNPVPLPPVRAVRDVLTNDWIEERDSWNQNVDMRPYHPCGWNGILPGPGLTMSSSLSTGVIPAGTSLPTKDTVDVPGPGGLVNGGPYVMGRLVMV